MGVIQISKIHHWSEKNKFLDIELTNKLKDLLNSTAICQHNTVSALIKNKNLKTKGYPQSKFNN